MKIPYCDYYEIKGFKIKNGQAYLKHDRCEINTTIRKDIHKSLKTLSKAKKKPMSKILDCIMLTFEAHPEIRREFLKRLREY